MSCLGTPAVGFGSHGQRSSDRVLATGKAHGWEGTNDPFPKLFQHLSVRVLRHRRRHDAGRGGKRREDPQWREIVQQAAATRQIQARTRMPNWPKRWRKSTRGSEPVDRRARVALKRRHEGAVIGHKEVRRGRCARGFWIGDSGFRIKKFQMAKSRSPHRSSISRWRLRTTSAGFNIFADRRDPARMPALALAPRAWTEHGSDQQRNG